MQTLRLFVLLACFVLAIRSTIADPSSRKLLDTVTDGQPGYPMTIDFNASIGPGTMASLPFNDSRLVRKATGYQPEGVHLTPWSNNDMLVSWTTGVFKLGPTSSPPPSNDPACNNTTLCFTNMIEAIVKYGTSPSKYTTQTKGNTSLVYRYVYDPTSGGNTYQSPIIHHVIITSLQPATTYYYSVGNDKDGWSKEFSFKTPPAANQYPLRLNVFGDLGDTANSSTTLDNMLAHDTHATIFVGDHSYADNHLSNATDDQLGSYWDIYNISFAYNYYDPASDQRRWDSWMRFVEPLLATRPMLSAAGDNHAFESQGMQNNDTFLSENVRFPRPTPLQGGLNSSIQPNSLNEYILPFSTPGDINSRTFNNNPNVVANNSYFGINYGPAHFISLNHYLPYGPDSPQATWFKDHVKNNINRTATPWLVVLYHTASYHTYQNHFRESDAFLQTFEPLFKEAGVDIVMNGHVHAYERSYPVYNYTLDECAPMYVTIGDGGNVEGLYKVFMDQAWAQSNGTLQLSGGGTCETGPTDPSQYLPSYQPTPTGATVVTLPKSFNNTFCPQSQPSFSAFRNPSFGSGVIEFVSPTKAIWSWYRTLPSAAEVVDNATITKNPKCKNQYLESMGPVELPPSEAPGTTEMSPSTPSTPSTPSPQAAPAPAASAGTTIINPLMSTVAMMAILFLISM